METREKSGARQIVPVATRALITRSAALVGRGLRDLARDSNWLVQKVFTEFAPHIAISPGGVACMISAPAHTETWRLRIHDIEHSAPATELAVPHATSARDRETPAAFGFSPTGRYLAAACGAWQPQLHVFDLKAKTYAGAFGKNSVFPSRLACSEGGKYLAAASSGKGASLRLWKMGPGGMPLVDSTSAELGAPDFIERQTYGEESSDEGAFGGYGRLAFSPDEKLIAGVAEVQGDWADDSILLMNAPTLERRSAFEAQGHITDLAWTSDNRHIIYCAGGQAYQLAPGEVEAQALPFGAELCACHPRLPLCVCFSSWLKNSAKGRLFVADLSGLVVFDEHAAEGVVDLRWSADGAKAYAVTQDGLAHIYELPLA